MAGFFGIGDYESAGVGIPKNAPKKKRIFIFFQILFNKIWQIFFLNLLYLIFCIPIVTIGPATTAMMKILRNFSIEKPTFIISDFLDAFKKNFKQSFIIGVLDLFIFGSVGLGFYIYPLIAKQNGDAWYIPFAIILSIGITFLIMNFYIYLMILSTDLSMKNILKNSFFLSFMSLKINILTLILSIFIAVVPIILISINLLFILFLPFFPLSFIGFIIAFNIYPIIMKYVIKPYYDKIGQPVPGELQNVENEEKLFQDKGGSEKPVQSKKKSRGKIIK